MEELNRNGFEVVKTSDIISGQWDIASTGNCMIPLEGSELPHGGGGLRCMAMPLRRTATK